MSTEIDPKEIAVLTANVKHLTSQVIDLLEELKGHRDVLLTKANTSDLLPINNSIELIKQDLILLKERESVAKSKESTLNKRLVDLETKVIKLEMETWKLGLLLGGSATTGSILALAGQYLINLL